MSTMNRLLLTAVCAALLAACGPSDTPQRQQEAVALAQRYLDAVRGGEIDRGWSLLHPSAREAWDSEADYLAAAENADWSTFEVSPIQALFCDDGVTCPIALDVENGEDSVPAFLRTPGRLGTTAIHFRSADGIAGNAEILVVLSSTQGPSGVALFGG